MGYSTVERKIRQITSRTLARWNKEGKINSMRTDGNHRRYIKKDIDNRRLDTNKTRKRICYCRVSTEG